MILKSELHRQGETEVKSQGPGTRSQGPGAGSQGPGTRSQGPGARSQGLGAKSKELHSGLAFRFWGTEQIACFSQAFIMELDQKMNSQITIQCLSGVLISQEAS